MMTVTQIIEPSRVTAVRNPPKKDRTFACLTKLHWTLLPCMESKASEVTTQMKAMVFKMLLVRLPFSIKVCFQTVTGKISVFI